jgi:hypothetical protein
MGLPAKVTLSLVQGQDYPEGGGVQTLYFSTADTSVPPQMANAVAYPLSGGAIKGRIRQSQALGAAVLLDFSSNCVNVGSVTVPATPPYGGWAVSMFITNAQTNALPAGEWYWDLFYEGAFNVCLVQGTCIVTATGGT